MSLSRPAIQNPDEGVTRAEEIKAAYRELSRIEDAMYDVQWVKRMRDLIPALRNILAEALEAEADPESIGATSKQMGLVWAITDEQA